MSRGDAPAVATSPGDREAAPGTAPASAANSGRVVQPVAFQDPLKWKAVKPEHPGDLLPRPLDQSAKSPLRNAPPIPPAAAGAAAPPTLTPAPTPESLTAPNPQPAPAASPFVSEAVDPCDPFAGQAELSLDLLVAEVEARNPSVQAAAAAWRAAAERYPQVVSLQDPMLDFMIGPAGVGTISGGGWMVQASQRLPWPGKLRLRGAAAAAEADAMLGDVGETRLRLAEAARTAFFDYYLAQRQQEVNAEITELVKQFREMARVKYETGQVMQQDVLQADVELAGLASRSLELLRDQKVAVARINTLLHRAPNCPLPPSPKKVSAPESAAPSEGLEDLALGQRPELAAQLARIRAEEANLALAYKEFHPDPALVYRYDAFMPEDMRNQIGLNVDLPIYRKKRWAAVREAGAKLQQQRAEYQNRVDQVRFDVRSAHERVVQAQQTARLYTAKILPAVDDNLKSARASYVAGRLDFLRLIDAQRQWNNERMRYYEAIAECHRRLAELERAVGVPLGPAGPGP